MKHKITLLNMLSGLLFQVCTILSGLIVPKLILTYFGSDVNGLVSSLNQFLNYIALIEGGVTSVVVANLYKPIIEKNQEKIDSILVTAKKFYSKIGRIFILYSIILSICYPIFINKEFSFFFVCSLTIILSLSLLIQYMFSLVLKTLLEADKKSFIVSLSQTVIVILNILLAFLSIKIYPNIHLLKLITGLLYILQPLLYGYYVRKNYLIKWNAPSDNLLIKERWNGFAINIAAFIHNSTDITILTIFTNLETVSVYSVYALVTNGIKQLINSMTSSIIPTIGHAYAKNDINKLNEKLDLYEYIIFFLVCFLFTITALLISPFVSIYTSGIKDVNYYQPLFGMLLALSEALYLLKAPHLGLAYAANKFKEIQVPAYLEAIINIVISIALVRKMGLVGVAIGTICGMLYRMVFHVYFTSKLINNRKQRIFYIKFIQFLITSFLGFIFCEKIIPINEFIVSQWIFHAILYCCVLGVLYATMSILFFRKELIFFLKYIKH